MKEKEKTYEKTYDMHLGNFPCHVTTVIRVLNPGPGPLLHRCCHPSCVVVCMLTCHLCHSRMVVLVPLLLLIKVNTY